MQDVIYFHNHSPLFPFHPLDQISVKSLVAVSRLGNNCRSRARQDLILGAEIITVNSETVFMHIAGGEECRQREALPHLQCKSFLSSFQVKTIGFPAWILSMEQQSSSETAPVMNFYSFVNGVMQTLWIRVSGKREGTKN